MFKKGFCALTLPVGNRFVNSFFLLEECAKENRLVEVFDDRFDMKACATIVVRKSLVVMRVGAPTIVQRYANLEDLKNLKISML